MQESAEICTLKNSHARQNGPTSLMISKRLVMVCVRQETSNTMFTILSLCLVSVNVLTALLMCRTWLIRVYFSSHYHDLFQITIFSFHYVLIYTPSQRGNYHHSMFHNPTAAVNLFHVGKQYLTFCKAEAAVTHNLIGRKIISNVKHSDARNSLPILDVIRSSDKRHSASKYCK